MSKHLGFWTLTCLVIANMIGAGVFTTSGYSLQALGSPQLVVAAWAVGGVIALAGAFSYGRLVLAMPESGGEYLFLSRAVHPMLGFIAGWVSMIAGFSGAIAFAATALEEYAAPPSWTPPGCIAVVSIVLAGAFHGLRPKAGALLQNAIVLLKLILLLAILLFAASNLTTNVSQAVAPDQAPSGWAMLTAFAGSLVWISLSYSGFNAAVYVAGEVEDGKRVVPKSLLVGTAAVAVLYVLLNTVFVYATATESIRGMPDVAAVAARALGGPAFETFVRWTIVACLLTSVFSMMMAAPRVYAKMADDGLMPAALRFQDDNPRAATLVQVVLAVILVMVTTLQGLLAYLGLTLSLCAAGSVACLFLPTIRTKPLLNPVHIPPAFFIAATITSATMITLSKPEQLLGTVVTFSCGATAYLATRERSASANEMSKQESADNKTETDSNQQNTSLGD